MSKPLLEKHTLRLRAGDVEYIRNRFPKVGSNAVIRRIVSNFVDQIATPVTEADLIDLSEDTLDV